MSNVLMYFIDLANRGCVNTSVVRDKIFEFKLSSNCSSIDVIGDTIVSDFGEGDVVNANGSVLSRA